VSKWTGTLRATDLIETVCGIHLSSYVRSPVSDRGGLMLVGPPGALKTTFLDVLDHYHNSIATSNWNTTTLVQMLPQMVNGGIRSIVIPDMHAIYAGDPRTAARFEAMIMQLAGEGTRGASWQDSRHQKFISRCTVLGAMTSKHFERHSKGWEDSGLLRRFLWCSYALADPDVLMRALDTWQRADIGSIAAPMLPADTVIEDTLTSAERQQIRSWLKHQPTPHEIQYALLCRTASALRWCYRTAKVKRDAMKTVRAFAETLQRNAALVTIP